VKLLVDAGNSRVKWAVASGTGIVATGEGRPGDAGLAGLPALDAAPDEIRLANVAGAAAGTRLAAALAARFGRTPLEARSATTGAGVRNGYTDPAQLGVDRWLAICAAYARYRTAVCVVDAGTATTVDVVAADGSHQGGLILPGMALMESSLFRGTGDLARLAGGGPAVERPGPAGGLTLGRDTAAAIRVAALQATGSLVLACGERVRRGQPAARLVLTGGAAPALLPAMLSLAGGEPATAAVALGLEHRPHLVLEGLALDPPCFRVDA
jgi:type III pantothenate kinase